MFHLDLCSGIGGFALAARWSGFQTIQFVEIDNWCKKILNKHWPDVPVHGDLKTFNGASYHGAIDILTAGYPCQPFSVAGKQLAEKDERHLWPEVLRVIKESKPRWVICENVEGHVKLGYDTVHTDLENEGYTVWPFIIPASGIGAKHQRKRIWIVAHSESAIGESAVARKESQSGDGLTNSCEVLADSSCQRLQRSETTGGNVEDRSKSNDKQFTRCCGVQRASWETEPSVGRVADGIPDRAHRLKGLGNAVVPQIPYLIMETIKQYELTNQGEL